MTRAESRKLKNPAFYSILPGKAQTPIPALERERDQAGLKKFSMPARQLYKVCVKNFQGVISLIDNTLNARISRPKQNTSSMKNYAMRKRAAIQYINIIT